MEQETRSPSHLQQVLDFSLLVWTFDAEQRASVHLAGLKCLPERHTARHVPKVSNLIAGPPRPPQTHRLPCDTHRDTWSTTFQIEGRCRDREQTHTLQTVCC